VLACARRGEAPRPHPAPDEILAIVELADASFATDTGIKRKLYARFGIADYLVVDLEHDVLLHYGNGDGADYREPIRLTCDDTLRLGALSGVELRVEAFLAPRS
jgi:hypothetical protein